MPLGTNVTTNPPDDVIIEVVDGGGGAGDGGARRGKRRVDVHVSWDPGHWKYLGCSKGGHECDKGSGVIHWHKRGVPAGGKVKVKLRLRRKKKGVTYIIVCVMDTKTGDYKGRRLRVA